VVTAAPALDIKPARVFPAGKRTRLRIWPVRSGPHVGQAGRRQVQAIEVGGDLGLRGRLVTTVVPW